MNEAGSHEHDGARLRRRIPRRARVRFARALQPLVRTLGFTDCEIVVSIRGDPDLGGSAAWIDASRKVPVRRSRAETDGERKQVVKKRSRKSRGAGRPIGWGILAEIARERGVTRQAVHDAARNGNTVILDRIATKLNERREERKGTSDEDGM